jgi:hypothetical protein
MGGQDAREGGGVKRAQRATFLRAARAPRAALAVVAACICVAACGGVKKHHVTKEELQTTSDYVDRNMRVASVTADDRRKYVATQLGAPHRTDGEQQYWYTTVLDCYYLQLGADGWASWGIGVTSDCKKWAVEK